MAYTVGVCVEVMVGVLVMGGVLVVVGVLVIVGVLVNVRVSVGVLVGVEVQGTGLQGVAVTAGVLVRSTQLFSRMDTLLELKLATARSRLPSPLKSHTTTEIGCAPTE